MDAELSSLKTLLCPSFIWLYGPMSCVWYFIDHSWAHRPSIACTTHPVNCTMFQMLARMPRRRPPMKATKVCLPAGQLVQSCTVHNRQTFLRVEMPWVGCFPLPGIPPSQPSYTSHAAADIVWHNRGDLQPGVKGGIAEEGGHWTALQHTEPCVHMHLAGPLLCMALVQSVSSPPPLFTFLCLPCVQMKQLHALFSSEGGVRRLGPSLMATSDGLSSGCMARWLLGTLFTQCA